MIRRLGERRASMHRKPTFAEVLLESMRVVAEEMEATGQNSIPPRSKADIRERLKQRLLDRVAVRDVFKS